MSKLLATPAPILAGVLGAQFDPELTQGTPGVVVAVLFGVWVTVSVFDKLGWLPTKNGKGGMSQSDHERLGRILEIVGREDPEKPGWPMVWNSGKEGREIRDELKRMVATLEETNRLLRNQQREE